MSFLDITMQYLGFPGGSAGKESTHNVGDLSLIPGLGRSPEKGRLPTPVFWPGEFHGLYRPWVHKELDTTERLSLHFTSCTIYLNGWWIVRTLFTILEIKRLEIYGFIEIVIKNMKFLVRHICVQIKNLPLVWNLAKAT